MDIKNGHTKNWPFTDFDDAILENAGASGPKLSELTGISLRTLKRHVAVLMEKQLVEYRGSKKTASIHQIPGVLYVLLSVSGDSGKERQGNEEETKFHFRIIFVENFMEMATVSVFKSFSSGAALKVCPYCTR